MAARRDFSRAFEPVSFGERYQQQHTSQLTALTGFVDAVRPDPPVHHELDLAARALAADPAGQSVHAAAARKTLQQFFEKTGASVPEVQQQMVDSPRLQPMRERAGQLAVLSQDGLDALRYLATPGSAPADWKSKVTADVAAAKKPSAIVRFTFVDALMVLVGAVK